MKATTTRRRLLRNAGLTGLGLLLIPYTAIGLAGTRTARIGARTSDPTPVMRHGWLLTQDDL
ncbi:hypothetical protein KG088_14100 [Halomonas sp. TRM85114]|uniref:hypothetical protein n=1 Tax=Halomonas jincaotanensis TaxID=2810616 RepID=UPI001BD4074B|nr:hypothetical protein [Halomonas jincaotanensis]MBS9404769.1 hypothetical protein [Halomonas jincaotanensis]